MPLKRVAVAAGGRWPQVVDNLIELDIETTRLDREEGIAYEKIHVTLIKHIHEVWCEGETFHSTADLISMLIARYPSVWGPNDKYKQGLTAQRMGRMLVKNYGIHADRTSDKVRGYSAHSFGRALQAVRMTPISEPAKQVEPDTERTTR